MSAREILKQIRELSLRERARLLKSAKKLQPKRAKRSQRDNQRVKWPDIEARMKRIFGNRVFPNAVLMEREESRY
jgi:hypothetical protein